MSDQKIITFLSDFGTVDGYAAAMKGVVLGLAPKARMVDSTHEIPPRDIQAGAWVLGQYWSCFPEGTIHVAVVDPGVGTDRAALLIEADEHIFLTPDNGLIAWVLKQAKKASLRKLRSSIHRPEGVSSTFQGRDVFAYAAGLLAGGKGVVEDLSEQIDAVVMPAWSIIHVGKDYLAGEIVHVDRFGNLITNIMEKQCAQIEWTSCLIQAGAFEKIRLFKTYGDAPAGTLIALFGSSGTLELAVVNGSASATTGLTCGMPVTVYRNTSR